MSESARLKNFGGVVRAGRATRVSRDQTTYRGRRGDCRLPGALARLGDAPSSRRAYQAHIHENHEVRLLLDQRRECGSVHGRGARASGRRPRRRLLLLSTAGVPHVAVNRGERPAVFVGARTDPNEQESVVMRPELDEKVP